MVFEFNVLLILASKVSRLLMAKMNSFYVTQKMKFFIRNFFDSRDQIRRKRWGKLQFLCGVSLGKLTIQVNLFLDMLQSFLNYRSSRPVIFCKKK